MATTERLNVFVPVSTVAAIEAAVGQRINETWTGALRHGAGVGCDGQPTPDPYPGAALFSGQWRTARAELIRSVVLARVPGAVVGRGVALGEEDVGPDARRELAPGDIPTGLDLTDPRESPARVYARWAAANLPTP